MTKLRENEDLFAVKQVELAEVRHVVNASRLPIPNQRLTTCLKTGRPVTTWVRVLGRPCGKTADASLGRFVGTRNRHVLKHGHLSLERDR